LGARSAPSDLQGLVRSRRAGAGVPGVGDKRRNGSRGHPLPCQRLGEDQDLHPEPHGRIRPGLRCLDPRQPLGRGRRPLPDVGHPRRHGDVGRYIRDERAEVPGERTDLMAIIPEGQGPKPAARPKSSGQVPHLGAKHPPNPASTSRIKPATVRSRPEVVASRDDDEPSEVRRSMATPPSSTLGLSLRWKIVIGMAAITIATAFIIFVTVNSKAVTQLSDEIDAKGVRLVKTLASIDAAFWKTAIGS